MVTDAAAALLAFVVAAAGTGLIRRYALKRNLLDIPNYRSSHAAPTPRGGGLAIVVASSLAFVALHAWGGLDRQVLLTLLVGGGAVALTGLLDDHYQLGAGIRLAVHAAAALCAAYWIGELPPLRIGDNTISFGWAGYVLEWLAIVWMLNLFNFMDGIDGIAASEATFVAWGGALLAFIMTDIPHAIPAASIALGAACCGFLLWNWPPAKIFMGDVGSGYLGYALAVLALAMSHHNDVFLFVWLMLGATFAADATVTLVRRIIRGERVHQAHRSHAYQWLARRWGSHRRVTMANMALNLLWLFPCALLATTYPKAAGYVFWLSLAPVVIAVIVNGAGRPETKSHTRE